MTKIIIVNTILNKMSAPMASIWLTQIASSYARLYFKFITKM
jgi:hypothetical protein